MRCLATGATQARTLEDMAKEADEDAKKRPAAIKLPVGLPD